MGPQCRHPECHAYIKANDWYYCSDHTNQLKSTLLNTLTPLVKVSRAFYIGRSGYPERRLFEHFLERSLDRMVVLHWSADWNESDSLEEGLIQGFGKYSKGLNRSVYSEGRHSGAWNCSYMAFSLKDQRHDIRDAVSIVSLDRGRRLWPIRACPMDPVYLKITITEGDAKNILNAYNEGE